MNIAYLVKLTSKAWSLKILALLHSGTPARQAPLLAATEASRSSFTSSLAHLMELGLVEKNPGHGHPLRPEFRLTPEGIIAAAMASRIIEIVTKETDFSLIRRNWAVPILAVTQTPQRFSHIKTGLETITDRALSKSLGILEEQEWLKRDIDLSHRAPFPTYHAINKGLKINQAVNLHI
ncbi:winged helix-turn-helix transcriptional regulator [Kordiimonas laminariae]|uniref:winged helix-turn-helix transcriptional regulator n=1 Tax=Kordiimonas laminariae TaxID=2917717 RepID=UPI001FF29E9B|nr:winged helix-turn-helix transcriptional regulator [Kordiimonas laminariae]MCK0068257.1 winged helix-turn-helix transcriptional regulator [Kordiimonas laminariae]